MEENKITHKKSVEAALRMDQKYEDAMASHEGDQKTFYRLIKKQLLTPIIVASELEVHDTTNAGNFLESWTRHLLSLATPTDNPHFNDEFKSQVKQDVMTQTMRRGFL